MHAQILHWQNLPPELLFLDSLRMPRSRRLAPRPAKAGQRAYGRLPPLLAFAPGNALHFTGQESRGGKYAEVIPGLGIIINCDTF